MNTREYQGTTPLQCFSGLVKYNKIKVDKANLINTLYNRKNNIMQQTAIQSQVEAIKKATQIASKSKEAALKFLVDAGIVRQDTPKETVTIAKIQK